MFHDVQGKAARIRSKQHLTSKLAALPELDVNSATASSGGGSSRKTSDGGASKEGGEGEAAEYDEEPHGVKLITSAHIRSAVIMANLIEGQDIDQGPASLVGGGIFSAVRHASCH